MVKNRGILRGTFRSCPCKVMSTYKKYLKGSHWSDFKTKTYNSGKGKRRCAVCGSYEKLNIYHTSYKRLGKEKASDVMILCKNCHNDYHSGKIDDGVLDFVNKHRRMFKQPVNKEFKKFDRKKKR